MIEFTIIISQDYKKNLRIKLKYFYKLFSNNGKFISLKSENFKENFSFSSVWPFSCGYDSLILCSVLRLSLTGKNHHFSKVL